MADGGAIAPRKSLRKTVEEYEAKIAGIDEAIARFEVASRKIESASVISGTYGDPPVRPGTVSDMDMRRSLLSSAWRHVHEGLNIDRLASATDKRRIEQMMVRPPPFTLENMREAFGDFVANPRGAILRALAETFCALDPAYKSHDKVRIGVKGLPKRIIITGLKDWSDRGWGRDRLVDVISALTAYQGRSALKDSEIDALLHDEGALIATRGVRLKRFANGNGHLFFGPRELRDINLALAEYYGDVLPDAAAERPDKPRPGTAVARDLQYYPTPQAVVDRVVNNLRIGAGDRVLEPSCGCGRFLDVLHARGTDVLGIEVDPGRADQCRSKGHSVLTRNFLETVPTGDFDQVVMNPPFYGQHYAKHVRHAMGFLKPGGRLTAILPATARYDHGLLDDLRPQWSDLPVGAFAESGTNICTVLVKIKRQEADA